MRVTNTRHPNLSEVLRTAVDLALSDVHTALPGRVEKYEARKQKADVKPLLKRTIIAEGGEEIIEEMPIIRDVPVVFPRAGGFFISFPIQKDDYVLLIFNERSIDKFVTGDGGVPDPVDLRMHNLSDAVAIPGFYPFAQALTDADKENLVIGKAGGCQVHLTPNEVHLGAKNPDDSVALASLVKSELDRMAGVFDDHLHTTSATVGPSGVLGKIEKPLTPMAPVADVMSTTVKSV